MEHIGDGAAGRSLVMGILNVTPDSFSDGGLYVNADAAVERAYRMVRQGADIVDVGGESTRPGATPLSARDEWDRIGSVVRTLANTPIRVSVDTYHAETARRAADAGAAIVNDVTGGHGDPSMLSAIAATGCTYILQHNRGGGASTDALASYGDGAAGQSRAWGSAAVATVPSAICLNSNDEKYTKVYENRPVTNYHGFSTN